jgi:hypothetical protein
MGCIALVLALSLVAFGASAWAQDEPAPGPDPAPAPAPAPDVTDYSDSGFGMDVSAYGLINFAWHVSFGAGAQFAYPIVPNGFIPNPRFRDALHAEGGFDFSYYFWSYGGYDWHLALLSPMVGVRYAVYVLDKLAPFATLKLGAAIPVATGGDAIYDPGVYFYMAGTVGILWDLSDMISLRAEFGYQYVGSSSDIWRIGVLFRI